MAHVFNRARDGGDDLQHLPGRHGGERHVTEDHHDGHGEERPAGAGKPGAEARGRSYRRELDLAAPAATVARTLARTRRQEDVDTGGDDDERDDDRERSRIDDGGERRAEIAEDQRPRAHRHADAPVHAAASLVEPGAQDAGKEKGEEGGCGGLMDRKPAEKREKRDHDYAADADGADQQADERGHRRDDDERAQPAAKATSSLVRSTASFLSSA